MSSKPASATVTSALLAESPERAAVADGEDATAPSSDELQFSDVVEIRWRKG